MSISKEAIARVFKDNPSLNKVWFTSDETPFVHPNDARGYALKLKDKTITPVEREISVEDKRTAKDLIAEIEAIETIDAFNAFVLPEGETRKTVIEAFDKKKVDLEPQD